jgi:transposase
MSLAICGRSAPTKPRPGSTTRSPTTRFASSGAAGPLVTAKLLGEIGDIRRFRSPDAFAMLAGVAPIPASSGQTSRMRLNRGGNRQINRALHGIVLAPVRTHPPAQAFVARKRADGKSWREAPSGRSSDTWPGSSSGCCRSPSVRRRLWGLD